MSITLIGGAPFGATTATVTTFAVPMPSGIQVGDLLIMQVVSSVTANPTIPAGWSIFEPNLSIGSPGPTHLSWFRWADATDVAAPTVSVTGPSGKYEAHIVAFRGVDPTTPKDVTTPSGTQSATATMAVPSTITTSTPGALVVLFAGALSASGVLPTWSSTNMTVAAQGTTNVAAQTNPNAALLTAPMAAAGSFSPAVTAAPGEGRSSMLTVALRPAASAPSSGSASGSWAFSGAATGRSGTNSGTATGSWVFTGAAAGRPTSITASGSWSFVGTATGGAARDVSAWSTGVTATTPNSPTGAGEGSWSFTGTASGGAAHTAGGSWSFAGSASGRPATYRAEGSWSFTGSAFGSRPDGFTFHQALHAIFIGEGASFARAFQPGEHVPTTVVIALSLGSDDVLTYTP